MVIPDTGALEQPIVPASRAETMTNSKAKTSDKIPAMIAITMLPAKKAPTMKIAMAATSRETTPSEFFSSPTSLRAFNVFLMEVTMTGINLMAPMIPPQSIIPAPMYLV